MDTDTRQIPHAKGAKVAKDSTTRRRSGAMARQVRMIPGTAVSLSENACIGFAEFNELNEGLNQWLSGKEEGAFAGNIWKSRLTNEPGFLHKKARHCGVFVKWLLRYSSASVWTGRLAERI